MVIHVEEREPFDGVAHQDQKGIAIFINLGKIEHVSPEEERSVWLGISGETNDVLYGW